MKPLLFVSLLASTWALTACAERERPKTISTEELAAMAKTARTTAAEVRGLALPEEGFGEAIASKAEIGAYLEARLDATDSSRLIRDAGRALEDLGALAPGTDLVAVMKKVTRDQVAGYYDWEKKTLYIADWMPQLVQQPVLVHEATHALQDAHFGLGRFMEPVPGGDDAQAAIQAVIEGDATLVMMQALVPDQSDARLDFTIALMVSATEQQIDQIDAPRFVSRSLVFPYTGGMQLARAVKKRGGWAAVDALYTDVPLSTEQVLHPEKYLDQPRDLPQRVVATVPETLTAAGWKPAFRGPQGELGLRILLRETLDLEAAAAAAAGWDGDEAVLLEREPGGATVTLIASVWDDEEQAREAADALRKTKLAPQALVQEGVRVAGLWGEPVTDAEAVVAEVARTLKATEAATFEALVGAAR